MFEKWTKKFASKATDGAVEGVKETLNDKIDQYGDIIKVGLVLSVIIFGGKHLTKRQNTPPSMPVMPMPGPYYGGYMCGQYGQPPMVVNNYISRHADSRAQRRERNYREQELFFQWQKLQQAQKRQHR